MDASLVGPAVRVMPEAFALAAVLLKAIGSLAGAAMALLIKPPKTAAEFFTRLGLSIISGVMFATPLREWVKWPATEEYVLASATLVGFSAWWALAAMVRFIEKWDGPKK